MARALPSIQDFPIPRDVVPSRGWTAQMIEMAAHIGAYDTLLLSLRLGGQEIYVPAEDSAAPFLPLVGAKKAKALGWLYRRTSIVIPKAEYALARARRAAVIAAARGGELTISDAARIMGVRRPYASKLVNGSDEGFGVAPLTLRKGVDPRQIDMFG